MWWLNPHMLRVISSPFWMLNSCEFSYMAVCQNLVPLVNIKIAGKWMFIPLKMVLIGIDPYPYNMFSISCHRNHQDGIAASKKKTPRAPPENWPRACSASWPWQGDHKARFFFVCCSHHCLCLLVGKGFPWISNCHVWWHFDDTGGSRFDVLLLR